MRARIIILGLLFAFAPIACGVVEEGKVERIEPQFGVDDTLPSSTSMETTTTQQATTTLALETTTTIVQTEPVRLYFVASGPQLTYVLKPLATPVAFPQIIAALQQDPPADVGIGLRTLLPSVADIRVDTDGTGVAHVTLPENFFDLVPIPNQRLVIAQLVLTLTRTSGIGQVVFNLAVPSDTGQLRPAGQRLTFSDYESMTDSQVGPNPTFSTSTTATDPAP